MPSTRHEGLLLLFRNQPELVLTLLRDVLKVDLPPFEKATVVTGDLTEVEATEHRADMVVLLEGQAGKRVVVLEVQLSEDPGKAWSWPVYWATARAQHRCPALVLVVAPDAPVARWTAQTLVQAFGAAQQGALVLGADAVPRVKTAAEAEANPELAVLGVMAHGTEEGAGELAGMAIGALRGLDEDRAGTYADLVLTALSEAARKALEDLMNSGYEFQSDFAKKYVAIGRQEGRQEGEARGKVEALLAVLKARHVSVSTAAHKRIAACTDQKEMEGWLKRAVTVRQVNDLFEAPKKPVRAKASKKPRAH
jgi:hypothetical protein